MLLLGVCLWELYVPNSVETVWRYVSAFVCAAFALGVIGRVLTSPLTMPRGELPGTWAGEQTPLMKAS